MIIKAAAKMFYAAAHKTLAKCYGILHTSFNICRRLPTYRTLGRPAGGRYHHVQGRRGDILVGGHVRPRCQGRSPLPLNFPGRADWRAPTGAVLGSPSQRGGNSVESKVTSMLSPWGTLLSAMSLPRFSSGSTDMSKTRGHDSFLRAD